MLAFQISLWKDTFKKCQLNDILSDDFPEMILYLETKTRQKQLILIQNVCFFFFIKEVHIFTVSTLQNLSILLHHVSIQVYLVTAKTRG